MPLPRLAKLSRPRLHLACPRPRLFNRFDQALAHGVIWIHGPAGCGKTTLAAAYMESRNMPGAWYQIDEDDSEPESFLHYLHLALPHTSGTTRTSGHATGDTLMSHARALFREFYGRLSPHSLVVFDGYHRLLMPSRTHDIFQNALSELPQDLALMIISREPAPASLSTHCLYGNLSEVGWNELRLDQDETYAIARMHGVTDRSASDLLHAHCKGWAAGLTLMLGQGRQGAPAQISPSARTFDYFAGEIFTRVDEQTRHLLLSTCMIPTLSAQLATELSADDQAPEHLSTLAQRGLFTDDLGDGNYRFHELFREFLNARLRQLWSPPQIRAHWSRAAMLLEADGDIAEAIRLRLEGQEWFVASRTILKCAPALLSQGRTQAVRDWILRLPGALVEASPRLLYTLGAAQIALSPTAARGTLERAHAGFVAQQDDLGQAAVAAAIIESIYFEYTSYLGLERWTDALLRTLLRAPAFTVAEVELRVYSSLQIGLTYRQPTHAYLPRCAEHILELVAKPLEVNQRVVSAGMLLNHYVWYAPEKSAELISTIRPLLKDTTLSTFNHLWWLVSEAHHLHYAGEIDAMRSLIGDAHRLAAQLDKQATRRLLALLSLVESVGSGDVSSAESRLEAMRKDLDPGRRQEGLIYIAMACQHAVFRGDWQGALENGMFAESEARATGILNCEYDGLMTQAIALAHVGDPEKAREALHAARALGLEAVSEKLRFQSLLSESFIDLVSMSGLTSRDDSASAPTSRSAPETLRAALALGRRCGYMRTFLWTPSLMARLCAVALEHGIETEYVRRLVCLRGLPSPDIGSEVWPWPLRIYTLGRFAILKNGTPITFARKAQQRPLDLLRAVAARPHLEVNASTLADELWPDADGDSASKALSMALHRLRKLLGNDKAVGLAEGKVFLDTAICWVDAHAFSQQFSRWDRSGNKDAATGDRLLRLYRGDFLMDESVSAQGLTARGRLKNQWLRFVSAAADDYARRAEWAAAHRIYECAIEIDPAHEVFHRQLIGLYYRAGREAEAQLAYERCLATLHSAGRSASFSLATCKASQSAH